jgi:hypothetical protein
MRAPSTRTRKILLWGSGPVAVLLAGAMVWQASNAAFTAETYNAGNNWKAGSVFLSNDGTGSAMFALPNIPVTPTAQTGSHCIVVTATSDVAGVVKTYLTNNASGGLQNNIKMKVEQGTGGSYSDCTGFTPAAVLPAVTDPVTPQPSLASMFTSYTNFETGFLPWTKGTGDESKTYKFTWTFDTTSMSEAETNALQGKSVQTTIEWEL